MDCPPNHKVRRLRVDEADIEKSPDGQWRLGLAAFDQGSECVHLLSALKPGDRSDRTLTNRWTADGISHGEDVLLNPGREAEQSHHLGYPGAGDPFPPGDFGLARDLARCKKVPPLYRLAEQLDDPGRRRGLGRLAVAVFGWERVDDPIGGRPARQGADVAIPEGGFWPKGDFDGLFAVGGRMGTVGAVYGDVDDAEPDFRLGPASAAASSTVTLGEPNVFSNFSLPTWLTPPGRP